MENPMSWGALERAIHNGFKKSQERSNKYQVLFGASTEMLVANEVRDICEVEWGVMFPPPHVNAFEVVWMPDAATALSLFKLGACVMVKRHCLPFEEVGHATRGN